MSKLKNLGLALIVAATAYVGLSSFNAPVITCVGTSNKPCNITLPDGTKIENYGDVRVEPATPAQD